LDHLFVGILLNEIANALAEIANALDEIANALNEIANALDEIANAIALHIDCRWAMPTLHTTHVFVLKPTNRNFCIPPESPEI
jgi:hypothetical protein